VIDVIRDLRITLERTISDQRGAAAVWTIEGTWDGELGPLIAYETPMRFEGTDVFELEEGQLRRVRRSFDELEVADALHLQTIVEPYGDGDLTFGHSMRSGGWLIFALPPAELAAHPAEEGGQHELSLMCDDVRATVAELKAKGVDVAGPISDEGFGLATAIRLPGGGELGLYEPRHPSPLPSV
jgi:SnoaL-like polyketide cyclase